MARLVVRWCGNARWPAVMAALAGSGLIAALAAVPAAAAVARPVSAARPERYNVGATHSPQLLRQLARSTHPAAPLTAIRPASTLLSPPPAAVPGDEQGVDVASFQHPVSGQYPGGAPVNWAQVATAGVGFAGIKVTEGAYYHNPFALSDLSQAQAAGLAVVAYAFAVPDGNGKSASPVAQADYLLRYMGAASRAIPVMLDIEYNPYRGGECYGLSTARMRAWTWAFAAEIQARTGRFPGVYTPAAWWDKCTGNSAMLGSTPLWVPDISSTSAPTQPAGWADWSIWQYGQGTVPGISDPGHTDLDQANPAELALLDPGPQRKAIGQAVTVPLSLALPAAGGTPWFSAAGLPPGLRMTGSGVITGWPTRGGTYRVQVSAGDGAASGRAALSWTVTLPRARARAGSIRFGLGGKCLDLAGHRTAVGTPAVLGWCGRGAVRWALRADRTVRTGGRCLSVAGRLASGARVVLGACRRGASQQWIPGAQGQLINAAAGKCLSGGPSAAAGARAWIAACTGRPNQRWALP